MIWHLILDIGSFNAGLHGARAISLRYIAEWLYGHEAVHKSQPLVMSQQTEQLLW